MSFLTTRTAIIAAVLLGLPAAGHTANLSMLDSGPIDLRSGTYSRTLISEAFDRKLADGTLIAGAQDATATSGDTTLSWRADVSTGEVGVAAESLGSADVENGVIDAMLFDTLTFDFGLPGSGLIEYALDVEATIAQQAVDNGYRDQTVFSAFVRVADVTGLADPFFLGGADRRPELMILSANSDTFFDLPADDRGTPARRYADPDFVSSEAGAVYMSERAVGVCDRLPDYGFCSERDVVAPGEFEQVSFTLEGSFQAEAGRTYALQVMNSASVNGTDGMLDAMSTSTFSFTDTAGATVFSASGQLPGTAPAPDLAPIPLPTPALLLLGGLAALLGLRRCSGDSTAPRSQA